jgi:mRNA deadenylase 3'-5' endonuclease subunit Ccr4
MECVSVLLVDEEAAKATAELFRQSEPDTTKTLPSRLPHIWNGQTWSKYTPPSESKDAKLDKLRVMTYNVWFEPFALERRAEELFRLISHYKPDIICFQEGTRQLILRFRDFTELFCRE